jgi:hypothetical protein
MRVVWIDGFFMARTVEVRHFLEGSAQGVEVSIVIEEVCPGILRSAPGSDGVLVAVPIGNVNA